MTADEMQFRGFRIFLCHSSEDKPEVRKLYWRLREAGFEPWLDEKDLLGGQKWELEIPRTVRDADVALIFLSEDSATKDSYFQKEIRIVLGVAEEKSEGRVFLIPVRLTKCGIPEQLKGWQWVDLFEKDGYSNLLRAIASAAAHPGSPLAPRAKGSFIQKKICMLGSFGVGKTSLVARFVQGIFSAKYLSTVGVKIDKKEIKIGNQDVLLVLWDLAGEDSRSQVQTSYLRGSSGYFLVCDGTWSESLVIAKSIQKRALEAVGNIPFVLVVNKSDLRDKWQITSAELEKLVSEGWKIKITSAKNGDGVEEMFTMMTEEVIGVKLSDAAGEF